MGLILNDNDSIHCEVHHNWGATLFTDFGHESINLDWGQIDEAIRLLMEAKDHKR